MRRAALLTCLMAGLLARVASAECRPPKACVDPESQWLSPSSLRFATISDPQSIDAGALGLSASFGFRLRPAVLTVPSPNRDGRDVNVVRYATDLSLAGRLGLGHGMELTLVAPAGLYQRGAGIKGVTSQSADGIPAQSLHDPRVGFGFELPPWLPRLSAKLRLEAKLPFGSSAAGSTEAGPVASPTVALQFQSGRWFAAGEIGFRLRSPSDLFGLRVGSQALAALGVGYEVLAPHLTFTLEGNALPSLIDSGARASTPAEWRLGAAFSPRAAPALSLGVAGGGGLPLSSDAAGTRLAYGVPTLRALTFVRYAPRPER